MRQILQDLRFGFRILWKSPGLSATAAVLIALVIGGNTTVFSIVRALMTRPAPGVAADRLVAIGAAGREGELFHPAPAYLVYREQARTVHPTIAFSPERFTLALDAGSYAFAGAAVTPDYFQTLGVGIAAGRGFTSEDNGPGAAGLAAVISDELWQDRFQRAPAAIGRPVLLNGHAAIIVGVAAPKFHGVFLGSYEDVWVPLLTYSILKAETQISAGLPLTPSAVAVIGRLSDGASLSQAQAEFRTLSSNLTGGSPDRRRQSLATVIPYSATAFGGAIGLRRFLPIFSLVTLITLVIVCANVANLMLGRAVLRRRETAVRQSLGASAMRILRMLFAEGLAISLAACAAACVASYWMTRVVSRIMPSGVNPLTGSRMAQANLDLRPDWLVIVYAMALAFLATAAFSLAPALQMWRQPLLDGLRSGEHHVVHGRSRLTRALVLSQLAFSVVLLTSAGLAYRSFSVTSRFDVGFNKSNLLLATVNPTLNVPGREANLALLERLHERFKAIPGVESVSYIRMPPPRDWSRQPVFATTAEQPVLARLNYLGPEFFRVLGVGLKAGREFSTGDHEGTSDAAILNERLAKRLWPAGNAVGKTFFLGREKRPIQVIGVAPDAFYSGPADEATADFAFLAEQQDQRRSTGGAGLFDSGETTFYLRSAGSLDGIAPLVAPAIKEVDARIPLTYIRSLDAQLAGATYAIRAVMNLLMLFAAVSLLIAAAGQYAIIAFEMRRRAREFGVRIALGASAQAILISVLGEALFWTAAGLAGGFALSAAAGAGFRALLIGVSPVDPRTYLGVFAVLTIVSLIACYLPARRASRVDPLATLREE